MDWQFLTIDYLINILCFIMFIHLKKKKKNHFICALFTVLQFHWTGRDLHWSVFKSQVLIVVTNYKKKKILFCKHILIVCPSQIVYCCKAANSLPVPSLHQVCKYFTFIYSSKFQQIIKPLPLSRRFTIWFSLQYIPVHVAHFWALICDIKTKMSDMLSISANIMASQLPVVKVAGNMFWA